MQQTEIILGEIFQKLNLGIEVEYLPVKDKEFLSIWFGEKWREVVINKFKARSVTRYGINTGKDQRAKTPKRFR